MHPQPLEDLAHLLIGDLGTQHPQDALPAQGHLPRMRQALRGGHFDDRARLTSHQRQKQLGGPLQGAALQLRIDAPLEAVGGIGVQAEAAGTMGGGDGVEVGALQEHVRGALLHPGALPAHHPSDRLGVVAVGDHQHLGIEGEFLTVQEREGLARTGHADHDAVLPLGE